MAAERLIASTCQGCLANCAVRVLVRDGGVAGVVGNAESAANHGVVCGNVRLAMQQLGDPDRLSRPLRRTNPRKGRAEDPRFVPITWDEALDEIADRMMELRARGDGHKLAVAKGRSTRIGDLLNKALPEVFGTPNRLTHASICAEAEKLATGCLDGHGDYHDYDLERARCVLMWGADPLSSNRQKTHVTSIFARLRSRAELIVVDPRRSMTAERSHRWLPVAPGTDGALACALAHVMLVEGMWNREFVGDFADGRNRFAPGEPVEEHSFSERRTRGLVRWWNGELYHCTPAWAATVTGLDERDVRAVAQAFARAGSRAVSWVSPGVTMAVRGLYSGMAAYALNGLAGSLGAEGGVLCFPRIPSGSLPDTAPFRDDVARRALREPVVDQRGTRGLMAAQVGSIHRNQATNRVADAILDDDPYGIEMMIACWCNWAFSCTGAQRWERALSKLPFLVHITTNRSEMSHFADIVLPARHHMFEAWGLANGRQALHSCVSLEQPCVEPLAGTRNDESDFPFDLALKLKERGFSNLHDYYVSLVDPVTGRRPSNGDELAQAAVKTVSRSLWAPDGAAPDELQAAWEAFVSAGVWNSPVARLPDERPFATPSGAFEFVSGSLRNLLEQHASSFGMSVDEAMACLNYEARGERCFMPHYERPVRHGDAEEFPLVFSQHRAYANLEGRSANTVGYQELKGLDPGDEPWDDVLKMHPDDVARFGLADGAPVRVTSPQGSITVRLKAWDGMRPGVVVKCYGQGHWAYGHVAALDFERGLPRGGNNNEVLPADWERISASTARHGGLVRVRVELAACGDGGSEDPQRV